MKNGAIAGGTVLIVCRTVDEVPATARLERPGGCRYVVASDDPAVHDACRRLDWVADVCWLEQMESFYHVAGDVLRLLDVINGWLLSVASERFGMPADFLRWLEHPEGGNTTRRLQDAALLIRSYLAVFEQYSVVRLVVCSSIAARWEDAVLTATAESCGIQVDIHGARVRRGVAAVLLSALAGVRAVLRVPFRVGTLLLGMLRMRNAAARDAIGPAQRADDGVIVFQLATAADKHLENVVPLMKALQQRRLPAVALMCFAPDGVTKVRKEGLNAEEVAAFLPLVACVHGVCRASITLIRGYVARRRCLRDARLAYRGVSLGDLLWPAIRDFLTTEVLQRYLLSAALGRYFESRPILAMKLWGETSLPEGYIAWKALGGRRPLLFDYSIGPQGEWPYAPSENPIGLFLTAGSVQTRAFGKAGIDRDRLLEVGSLRYDGLAALQRIHTPEQSRALLGINEGYSLYVLWDPSVVMRGFFTAQEQLRIADALLDLVAARSCALIVKPHPGHNPGPLERLIEQRSLSNVFYVPGAMLPYHAINAADVVLTKFSTLGLEGMRFGKPIVSVMLDGEPRWRVIYEDAVEYITALDDMTALLARLVERSADRATWIERRLSAQELFLAAYFCGESNPVTAASTAIAARLSLRSPLIAGERSVPHAVIATLGESRGWDG
jgi:hypothetical protein